MRNPLIYTFDKDTGEVSKLRAALEKSKHLVARQESELLELREALQGKGQKLLEKDKEQKLEKEKGLPMAVQEEDRRDRHRLLLVSMAQRWFEGAPWELVRVLWSGWKTLQQDRRRNLEVAKARRELRIAQKPLHLQVLQRWVAQNDSHAIQMCFLEWHSLTKEIRALAKQKMQEKDRKKDCVPYGPQRRLCEFELRSYQPTKPV